MHMKKGANTAVEPEEHITGNLEWDGLSRPKI